MAPQQQQLPTRSSGRTPKPSERKRAQSAPISAILQPSKKKVKRKTKIAKKRQKTILVPSLLPSPLPPSPSSPATPAEPISADEVDKDKDKNTKEPIEVEDKDIGSPPPPPPPVRFISVWKAVIGSGKESLPSMKSAVFDTKNIYYFKLEQWQNKTVLNLLPQKFKITHLRAITSYKKAR